MTGADRGLGRAMSLGLARKGARLVLASPVMDGRKAVAEFLACHPSNVSRALQES